jgi:hypothetical protein
LAANLGDRVLKIDEELPGRLIYGSRPKSGSLAPWSVIWLLAGKSP